MISRLTVVEGIGDFYAQRLTQAGVDTPERLLRQGATATGRQRLVERTGIGADLILRWVNHVDLTRIHGVGGQYAELLEAAGVDSVPELAHRNPESLYARMAEVNQARRLVRQLPALPQVRKWVSQAASLPRVVMH